MLKLHLLKRPKTVPKKKIWLEKKIFKISYLKFLDLVLDFKAGSLKANKHQQ